MNLVILVYLPQQFALSCLPDDARKYLFVGVVWVWFSIWSFVCQNAIQADSMEP